MKSRVSRVSQSHPWDTNAKGGTSPANPRVSHVRGIDKYYLIFFRRFCFSAFSFSALSFSVFSFSALSFSDFSFPFPLYLNPTRPDRGVATPADQNVPRISRAIRQAAATATHVCVVSSLLSLRRSDMQPHSLHSRRTTISGDRRSRSSRSFDLPSQLLKVKPSTPGCLERSPVTVKPGHAGCAHGTRPMLQTSSTSPSTPSRVYAACSARPAVFGTSRTLKSLKSIFRKC